MSQNEEIVRQSTEAYSRGDLDATLASWTSDAVLDWSNSRGLEPSVVRGTDEIRTYMERFREAFDDVRIEIEDIFEADEGVVIVENTAHFRGRDGIRVTAQSAWVVTLRDGRQTSLTLYQSKAEALEAAGP
jgi:ketosteroid isomerase-like protein